MTPKFGGTPLRSWRVLFLSACLLGLPLFAEARPNLGTNSTLIIGIAPCAAAVDYARTHHIPVSGIDPLANSDTPHAGDSITVLVTLSESGGKRSQWLLYTQIAGPPGPTNGAMTIYNSFGNKFEFPSMPTPVTLRTIGPFVDVGPKRKAPKVHDDKAGFDLDKGYLGLGLDAAAAAIARNETNKIKGRFASGTQPFSAEQIKRSKESAAEWKMTADEERALGGSYPALLSYFGVVQHTEGLEDILFKVLDRPSVFSLAVNLGIRSVSFSWHGEGINMASPSVWGLSESTPIYEVPMTLVLNDHPSLEMTMIVTRPRPPLLTSAGALGIIAHKPGKPEPYLMMRILNGHLAPLSQGAK